MNTLSTKSKSSTLEEFFKAENELKTVKINIDGLYHKIAEGKKTLGNLKLKVDRSWANGEFQKAEMFQTEFNELKNKLELYVIDSKQLRGQIPKLIEKHAQSEKAYFKEIIPKIDQLILKMSRIMQELNSANQELISIYDSKSPLQMALNKLPLFVGDYTPLKNLNDIFRYRKSQWQEWKKMIMKG